MPFNTSRWPRERVDALGDRRVFIFEWGVHHGDGNNEIFRASDAVLFASIPQARISRRDTVHDMGARAGEGFSINLAVPRAPARERGFTWSTSRARRPRSAG